MATFREREIAFAQALAKSKATPAEKNQAKVAHAAKLQAERDAQVAQIKTRMEASESGLGGKLSGIRNAALMGAVQTASLGHFPKLVGLVGGEEARESLELERAASQQLHPYASGAGTLAGFFGPGAGQLLRGAGRLATTATGTGRLAAATAERGFAAKAGAQVAQNFAGGAGAITTQQLLESRNESYSLGARLHDAGEVVRSPLNIALTGTAGLAAAKFTRAADKDLRHVIERYERATGQKVTTDVLTDSKEQQQFMDMAARIPGVAETVQKVRENLFAGMRQMIREMGSTRGLPASREAARGAGAAGVRRLRGTKAQPGAITESRRGPEALALAAEGSNALSAQGHNNFVRGLKAVLANNPGRERAAGFRPIVKEVVRLGTRVVDEKRIAKPLTLYELENLRKQTARLAFAGKGVDPLDPRLSEKSRLMARDFYHVIDEAIGSVSPRYQRALQAGEKLRRMEEALPMEKLRELDDAVMGSFWMGKGALTRLEALKERGRPEDLQMARGWLFHRLIEKTANKETGLVSVSKLDNLTSAPGMFNSQILDKALPGVRRELRDLALLSQRMQKGIARAEGSQTSTVGARAAGWATGGAAIGATIAGLFTNPATVLPAVLGPVGVALVVRQTMRSAVGGALQHQMGRLVREGPRGISRLPVAAQEGFGLTPYGR
jgi:hypothetical protein